MEITALLLPLFGLASGTVLGFVARRNYFCTLSALEQHWYGGNSAGVRTWVLAAASAIIFTQASVQAGFFDPTESFYLNANFSWLGAIIGGLCFGFGMALVGTCGYGALVRLGGGSLKSLMTVLVLGLAALSTQRGLLALGRTQTTDRAVIDFSEAGDQSIPTLLSYFVGFNVAVPVTILIVLALLYWIFKDSAFRANKTGISTGLIVGFIVASGWWITSYLSSQSFHPVQVESASFVAPISDVVMQFGIVTGIGPDYGVGMVAGVVLGSAIAARLADNVRWEACDDARELSRHILGALLMGFGGVLAIGCTIGQGISAASLLAVSVPLTIGSILIGARIGLAWLLEGDISSVFRMG
ncbi:MAG: YeeE/YedE family protein [Pseudomonadota bacterium]